MASLLGLGAALDDEGRGGHGAETDITCCLSYAAADADADDTADAATDPSWGDAWFASDLVDDDAPAASAVAPGLAAPVADDAAAHTRAAANDDAAVPATCPMAGAWASRQAWRAARYEAHLAARRGDAAAAGVAAAARETHRALRAEKAATLRG